MEYRCISADCHIDLCWLPHDLFVANASHAMKGRMPYVVDGPDGPKWVAQSAQNLGYANGKGGTGAVSANGYKYAPGRATFQYDRIGMKLLDEIGVETLMWASDYPHPDGVFPDSQEYISKQFGAFVKADIAKMAKVIKDTGIKPN